MCDGPMNHFHIQLIPRYNYEKRGSENFVKQRTEYIEDTLKKEKIKRKLEENRRMQTRSMTMMKS